MRTNEQPEIPRDDIALYALGALSDAEAEQVANWLATDGPAHQDELAEAEQVAALLGHVAPLVAPPSTLKSRLLERLQTETAPALLAPSTTSPASSGIDFNQLDWQPSGWDGVSVHWLRLDEATGNGAVYFKILPGYPAPNHRHQGGEDCLILQGGFSDTRGTYRAGDLVYYEPGSVHEQLRAADTEDCILFVVYQEGGMEVLPSVHQGL